MLLRHYTTGERFVAVVEKGRTKPTTYRIDPREPPAVWFSTNQWREAIGSETLQSGGKPCKRGGKASSGVALFFGSVYAGSDKTLVWSSGGSPAVKLAGGSGNLKWAWSANTTGND